MQPFLKIGLLFSVLACSSCVNSPSSNDNLADAGNNSAADAEQGDLSNTALPSPDSSSQMDVANTDPRVRVATFNVRRFFDTQCDSFSCGGNSFEATLSEEEFAQKAEQISAAVRDLEADIVLLQEVEKQDCLNALMEKLNDLYTESVLGEIGTSASLDVAILSTGSILEVRTHRQNSITRPEGGETRFSREFLEVHLEHSAGRVVLFNSHFKSKSNDDASRRMAEATAAHDIVLRTAAEFPEALVVFGGDLNDTPGSDPLNALEAGGDLFRVSSELSQDWTYATSRGTSAIDHLYVVTTAAGEFVSGSAKIFRDGRGAWGGSDHAALTAEFTIPQPEE